MKKLVAAAMALVISVGAMASNENVESKDTYKVNTEKSVIKWIGTKVTGKHYGKVEVKEGSFAVNGEEILSGKVHADMTSITCEDLEGEYADKLVGHLKSDDFFGVEKFPEATFEVVSFKGMEANTSGKLIGKLTIKGHTENIEVPVDYTVGNGVLAIKGEVKFDRTKFDIKYGSASFIDGLGDKAINDEVKFSFALIANK